MNIHTKDKFKMGGKRYDTPEAALDAKRRVNREAQKRCRKKKAAIVRHSGDLTREEIIEIVNLVFPFSTLVKDEMTISHFDGNFGNWIDLRESATQIRFRANVRNNLPDTIDEMVIIIFATLDIASYYKIDEEDTHVLLHKLPVHNQYRIQEKFREWKICPRFVFD